MATVGERLLGLGSPDDLLEWVKGAGADEEALWKSCPRGDWLVCLEMAKRVGTSRRGAHLLACVAASVRELIHKHCSEVREAGEALSRAEAWSRGKAAPDACDQAAVALRKMIEKSRPEGDQLGSALASCLACDSARALAAAAGALGAVPPSEEEQVSWNKGGAETLRLAFQKTATMELTSALYFAVTSVVFAGVERVKPDDVAERLQPERFASLMRACADELRQRLEHPESLPPPPSRPWWKFW
jgi:hypothetical protein